MSSEIKNLSAAPYRSIVLVTVTFPDGTRSYGTGALVGRNDILTATHVVYNPDRGGWAETLGIQVGVDYNHSTNKLESQSQVQLSAGFRWEANAWPQQTYADSQNGLLTWSESQYDVALIGLSEAIGDQVGWFGMASGYNQTQWAYQIGYPSGSSGMMLGKAWIEQSGFYSVYNTVSSEVSDIMGAGSSGGPLFVYQNGTPYIIGVKSSGSTTASTWADIGLVYDQLIGYIDSNDSLLTENTILGTAFNDRLHATTNGERIDGRDGLDVLVYDGGSILYEVVLHSADTATVSNRSIDRDVDALSNIERIQFSDGTLALDIAAGEIAGSAYRLYQAAFGRTPDSKGLSFWVNAMDTGTSLWDVAAYFTRSPEFAALHGQNPSDAALLSAYYAHVHGRQPDDDGYAYWMKQMNTGMSDGEVLAYFSESPENLSRVQGAIENGIGLS